MAASSLITNSEAFIYSLDLPFPRCSGDLSLITDAKEVAGSQGR